MDYGRLIGDAWRIAWRYRFLWFFGVFAGSSGVRCGSGVNYQTPNLPPGLDAFGPAVERSGAAVGNWLQANLGLVLAAACLVVLLVIGLFVLSTICQGALVAGAGRIEQGEPTTFGDAWRAGRQTFWRFLGLNIAGMIAMLLVAVLFIPAGILAAIGAAQVQRGEGGVLIVLGVLTGLAALVVAVPLWIGIGIVVSFAMRAVGVDRLGLGDGIRRGIELLQRRLGASVLLWLLSLALGIGGSIAAFVLWLVAAVPLGGIAAVAVIATGFNAATIALITVVIVLLILAGAVLVGVLNSFLWTYWTLGYMRLQT